MGDFKLFFDRKSAISAPGADQMTADQAQKVATLAKGEGPVLFNVIEDPGETIDLSEKYPEKVKQMWALADKTLADIEHRTILPIDKPDDKTAAR